MSFLSGALEEECLNPTTAQCSQFVGLFDGIHLVRLVLQVHLVHHSVVARHLVQLDRRFLRVPDLNRVHILQDLQDRRVQTHVPDHLALLHILGILLTSHLVRDRLRHYQRAVRPVTICKIKVSS
jgi:hypothetical protein